MSRLLRLLACLLFLPLLLVVGLLCRLFRRRDIVQLPPDHPDMAAAIAEARRTYDAFLETFRAAPAGTRDFCVKVRLAIPDAGHEHCWCNELAFDGAGLTGVLNNEPQDVESPKLGERIAIPADDVTDWGHFRGSVAEGFFTTRALVPHVKGKVRVKLLESMGWTEERVRAADFAVPVPASAAVVDVVATTPPPLPHGAEIGARPAGSFSTERRPYRTDLSKLTFGECRRFGRGFLKGCFYWVLTRAASPGDPRQVLPLLQADTTADRGTIAPDILARIEPRLAELAQHGFRVTSYQRMPAGLDGKEVPSGGAVALSADGRTVATVNFIRKDENPPESREILATGLGAFLEDGGVLWATTLVESFDPLPGSDVATLPGADFEKLQRGLDRLVERHAARRVMRLDDATLPAAMDREDLAAFRDRLERRKLWVPAED